MKVAYHNLYIHFVLTVKDRETNIREVHRERIEKYIIGIFRNHACRVYSIYVNPEHVHVLISKSPSISENELILRVAISTASFINKERLSSGRFVWQDTCSGFSVSKRDVSRVCRYIENQPIHHKQVSHAEELKTFQSFYQMTIRPSLPK